MAAPNLLPALAPRAPNIDRHHHALAVRVTDGRSAVWANCNSRVSVAAGREANAVPTVRAGREDDVDVCEVDREDRMGLRDEELRPGGAGPEQRGVDAAASRTCHVEVAMRWPSPVSSSWMRR
jgi:hypothetical protein